MANVQLTVSFSELCDACGAEQQILIDMIEFGVIETASSPQAQPEQWQFQTATIERAQKALRLHQDLAINFEGVALALDLLEEIDALKAQIEDLTAR